MNKIRNSRMKITKENNFCRVFELPEEYPSGFCFGGGKPVIFQMVDWFNPLPPDQLHLTWQQVIPLLMEQFVEKVYIKPDRQYLVLTDFGESLIF